MLQTFKAAYPKETVIQDPVAQMRMNIARAKAASGQVGPDEFTYLAAAFGEAARAPAAPAGDGLARLPGTRAQRQGQTRVRRSRAWSASCKRALAARNLGLTEAAPATWQVAQHRSEAMSAASSIAQVRERLAVSWLARTEQERKFLAIGGALALLALVYALFVAPALAGRAQLEKDLPQLRQQAAQLRAMALEAGELARQPAVQVAPMTRESLTASLAALSITPQSLTMTGEYARIQLAGVSFANLVGWLDAQRRENRIAVQDAAITRADARPARSTPP